MSDCQRKGYMTAISAQKAAKKAGGKGQYREVERCTSCGRWHVKPGLV